MAHQMLVLQVAGNPHDSREERKKSPWETLGEEDGAKKDWVSPGSRERTHSESDGSHTSAL